MIDGVRLSCVDLFAGCGGLSLGLELAGFEPILFSELNPSAAETYIANRPGSRELWVPDVYSLTPDAINNVWIPRWQSLGIQDVDLVCGGPPCQGYSGIGHRRSYHVDKHEVPSNHLYKQMIEIIKHVRPKMFLFENVRGITFGKWTPDGEPKEIWMAVQKAFQSIEGYVVPDGTLVYAADYGVPQKRPRAMIVGIRAELANQFRRNKELPAEGLLPGATGEKVPNISDILGDLVDTDYKDKDSTLTYPAPARSKTQKYYRLRKDDTVAAKGDPVTDHQYSHHSERIERKFRFMIDHNGKIPRQMKTKKFAQRVLPKEWDSRGPTITVTSLPDDFVHFEQPRILTVREWARLQTFPDWYEFRGPRTTGGHRRAGIPTEGIWEREVPRYTQIGNAVPVKLALEIGKHFASILNGTTSKTKVDQEVPELTLV
jgi:DNA (cytosine-5)-methyltransferase 1